MTVIVVVTVVLVTVAVIAATHRRNRRARHVMLRNAQIQQATVSAVADVQRHYNRATWIAAQQSVARASRRNQHR